VIWTDVIQTILLALGAVLCLIVVIVQVPGGLGEIFGPERSPTGNSALATSRMAPCSRSVGTLRCKPRPP